MSGRAMTIHFLLDAGNGGSRRRGNDEVTRHRVLRDLEDDPREAAFNFEGDFDSASLNENIIAIGAKADTAHRNL